MALGWTAPGAARGLIAVGAATLFGWLPAADDLATKIKAKEPLDRVAAVDAIRRDGHKEAEKLLLSALDDRDWEVIEHAAVTLGERGSAASLVPLGKLALEGPVRRVRLAAAQAMAKLDAKAAADHLTKAIKGATQQRACEGLAVIADAAGEAARTGVETGLSSKDVNARATAASGLNAFPAAERAARLVTCLEEENLVVGAAALEAVRRHPDAVVLPTLLSTLAKRDLPEVFERRVSNAIEALFAATAKEGRAALATQLLDAAKAATTDVAATRFARVVGRVAAKPPEKIGEDHAAEKPEPLMPAAAASSWLEGVITRGQDGPAAAAVHALGQIASDAALDKLNFVASGHGNARVRSIAMRDLVAHAPPASYLATAKRLLADADAQVREDAVVALGRPGMDGAVEALLPLLKDGDWPVAVAAAVSLGKTQDPAAFEPLSKLADSKEWKLAGAALVGLGHLKLKAAVARLIAGLGEKSPTLKLTAFEFLRRMTRDKVAGKESLWKSWWQKNEPTFQFPEPSETAKQQQKYGYAPSAYGVYEDLDLLVFQSRGDHIEKLLEKLKIDHRTTRGNEVPETGVSPLGIYVANCTGECAPEDLEQVQWVVHVGGYLFSSCWALTFHSSLVRPGFTRQLTTRTQVLDLVTAEPCRESPYLAGVFDGISRPKYVLEGAHLIDVLDHERVEVLIDSPECATRWGGGNLAAWWTVGHGLILDSVNHFDLQGFDRAPQMKEPADRMAYAIDTMGLTYADLRDVPRGAWQSQSKAAEEVRDLSAFRFITNFVRQKRKTGS